MAKLDGSSNTHTTQHHGYELMFIKLTWFFIIIGMLYIFLTDAAFSLSKFIYCIFILLLNLFRDILHRKGLYAKNTVYYAGNIVWLCTISFAIVFLNFGSWAHALILFTILAVSLTRNIRVGMIIVVSSFVIQAMMTVIAAVFVVGGADVPTGGLLRNMIAITLAYFAYGLFAFFCGRIYKDGVENEMENMRLVGQLEEKFLQLESAQDEIKTNNEHLKEANIKLEETNKKLSGTIAEFYTLQQISQAISSILDIRELLKYLNDIILGVMGVSCSTVILFDERTRRLKVHVTNINNVHEMAIMIDNVNCFALLDALDEGKQIMENTADPGLYPFISGRKVKSLICIPLNTKSRKFGLVLVEHKYGDAFDNEDVRLLNIIAQQVGIAMENAELYQKMQELASKDGLTGVYNRQYFQERLSAELIASQREGCPLSLAIYDIDHFKNFNDTYGHLFGDKVLKSITEAVSSSLRKNDIIARFGGEEFIILFPRTSLSEAYEKVEFLRKMISAHTIKDNLVTTSVTVSFGVSCCSECALTENELLRTADDALYEAKAAGRNCVRVAGRI